MDTRPEKVLIDDRKAQWAPSGSVETPVVSSAWFTLIRQVWHWRICFIVPQHSHDSYNTIYTYWLLHTIIPHYSYQHIHWHAIQMCWTRVKRTNHKVDPCLRDAYHKNPSRTFGVWHKKETLPTISPLFPVLYFASSILA